MSLILQNVITLFIVIFAIFLVAVNILFAVAVVKEEYYQIKAFKNIMMIVAIVSLFTSIMISVFFVLPFITNGLAAGFAHLMLKGMKDLRTVSWPIVYVQKEPDYPKQLY